MKKTLESGLVVNDQQYYKLLEWKDNNMEKFIFWCIEYGLYQKEEQVINKLNPTFYRALVDFANID